MGIRYRCFVFIFVMLLTTVGCSNEKIVNNENGIAKNTEEITISRPPKLTVSVDGNKLIAGLGSYSWKNDNGDGTFEGIYASSGPPPEFAGKELFVKPQSEVHLSFEETPSDYEVRIWKTDNDIAIPVTNNTFTTTQNKGNVIYEVVASWEQGTAAYAFSLNVK